jgi:hypothetical protein
VLNSGGILTSGDIAQVHVDSGQQGRSFHSAMISVRSRSMILTGSLAMAAMWVVCSIVRNRFEMMALYVDLPSNRGSARDRQKREKRLKF